MTAGFTVIGDGITLISREILMSGARRIHFLALSEPYLDLSISVKTALFT